MSGCACPLAPHAWSRDCFYLLNAVLMSLPYAGAGGAAAQVPRLPPSLLIIIFSLLDIPTMQELGELRRKGEEAEARVAALQTQLEALEDAQVLVLAPIWSCWGCRGRVQRQPVV